MNRNKEYSGALTREQFLFYEIRIAAKLYLAGIDMHDAIKRIKEDNLFQFLDSGRIKTYHRLVQNKYFRVVDQSAHKGYLLLHSV